VAVRALLANGDLIEIKVPICIVSSPYEKTQQKHWDTVAPSGVAV
jgi:hypothetical protein